MSTIARRTSPTATAATTSRPTSAAGQLLLRTHPQPRRPRHLGLRQHFVETASPTRRSRSASTTAPLRRAYRLRSSRQRLPHGLQQRHSDEHHASGDDGLRPLPDRNHGWPGNLGDFLNADGRPSGRPRDTTGTPRAEISGRHGLNGHGDRTREHATVNGKVVCNGTGPIVFSGQASGTSPNPFGITMVSHGAIDISGLGPPPRACRARRVGLDRQALGAHRLRSSSPGRTSTFRSARFFTPRSGQDVSGSVNATLCVQMIGQGMLRPTEARRTSARWRPGAESRRGRHADPRGPLRKGCNPHFSLGRRRASRWGLRSMTR